MVRQISRPFYYCSDEHLLSSCEQGMIQVMYQALTPCFGKRRISFGGIRRVPTRLRICTTSRQMKIFRSSITLVIPSNKTSWVQFMQLSIHYVSIPAALYRSKASTQLAFGSASSRNPRFLAFSRIKQRLNMKVFKFRSRMSPWNTSFALA
jgi:hypothetical protein